MFFSPLYFCSHTTTTPPMVLTTATITSSLFLLLSPKCHLFAITKLVSLWLVIHAVTTKSSTYFYYYYSTNQNSSWCTQKHALRNAKGNEPEKREKEEPTKGVNVILSLSYFWSLRKNVRGNFLPWTLSFPRNHHQPPTFFQCSIEIHHIQHLLHNNFSFFIVERRALLLLHHNR